MDFITALEQILPEAYPIVVNRMAILQSLHGQKPIGRRGLASKLEMTERTLRSETDVLREQKLIRYEKAGMCLTEYGKQVYDIVQRSVSKLMMMTPNEQEVASVLGLTHCRIVEGDFQQDTERYFRMGLAVQELMMRLLPEGDNVIAVTGGQTMAEMAEAFNNFLSVERHLTFVPARGGVSGSSLIQSNSVCERLAKKVGADYMTLYIPEKVSVETYQSLMQEPEVSETIQKMQNSNCLLYSVGSATIMAKRRNLSPEELQLIIDRKAVGEVFGSFFNAAGEVVLTMPRVGLHLEDLCSIPYTIAVVGGKEKADALKGYAKLAPKSNTWFVLDEGVANMVLNGETR